MVVASGVSQCQSQAHNIWFRKSTVTTSKMLRCSKKVIFLKTALTIEINNKTNIKEVRQRNIPTASQHHPHQQPEPLIQCRMESCFHVSTQILTLAVLQQKFHIVQLALTHTRNPFPIVCSPVLMSPWKLWPQFFVLS